MIANSAHHASHKVQGWTADGKVFSVGADHSDTRDRVNPRSVGQFWVLARIKLAKKVEAGAKLKSITFYPARNPRYTDPRYLFCIDQVRVQDFQEYMKQPAPEFKNIGPKITNIPLTPDGARPRTLEQVTSSVQMNGDQTHFSYTTRSGEKVDKSGQGWAYCVFRGKYQSLRFPSIRKKSVPSCRSIGGQRF